MLVLVFRGSLKLGNDLIVLFAEALNFSEEKGKFVFGLFGLNVFYTPSLSFTIIGVGLLG